MRMRCPYCEGRGEVLYYVETARDETSVTVKPKYDICRKCNGSGETPMTNADRIRAMTDDELAHEFALVVSWDRKEYRKAKRIGLEKVILDILQQPAEGGA